jgi:hypothetical protein
MTSAQKAIANEKKKAGMVCRAGPVDGMDDDDAWSFPEKGSRILLHQQIKRQASSDKTRVVRTRYIHP